MVKPLTVKFAAMAAALSIAIAQTSLAAVVNWTGTTSFWDIAANWSSNPLLPGAADDVLIDVAGIQTITHRSGTDTINSLSMPGDDLLAITGGTLTVTNAFTNAANTSISLGDLILNGASTMDSLTLSGGALGGTGTVTIAGASTWTGGTQTGTGTSTFNGTLAISGLNGKAISSGRTVNAGNTTWSGNTASNNNAISISATSIFNNTGTFADSNTFDSSISGGTFNNAGTFNKQSNTTTSVNTVFNNTGTVNVNAGTFLPGFSGTSTGTFNIANGAKLEYRNGSHTLNNVTISGAGTFQISTDNVGGDAVVTLNGGTLTSAFLMSGSTMNGTDQVFSGPAIWTGGTITGTAAQSTTFGGVLTISGLNTKVLSGGRTVNAGNTTWTGNTANNNNAISISGASIFNNTGTFTDSNTFDSSINVGGGGGTYSNNGTFNKQSNTITSIGTLFNSTGTVNVNAGTLLMNGGGTDSGTFNIANGAKLEFRNGSHTLNNVTISGAGTFEISTDNVGADAIVTLNGGMLTSAFVLSGSILTGTSHTFQGVATWSGGTITGPATASTTFANALTISGPNSKTLSGGRNVNAGDTTWTGNTANGNNSINISGASVFNSSGTFTDANTFDSAINVGNGGGTFVNNGTFNKQSNTTTAVGTQFSNAGMVNVNAGLMLMNGGGTSNAGVFNIANGAKLEFRNGNYALNNVTTSGAGVLQISTDGVGADAVVAVHGGTHTTPFILSGSTLTGTDNTFQGPVTWSGGTISGAASTTFTNNVAITGANPKTVFGGRVVNLEGITTWSGNTAANNNAIQFWNGGTINNFGTFNDSNPFNSFIEHVVGGPHNFNNLGTYNKTANTTTTVDLGVVFNNSGIVNLNAGVMDFVSGTQGPTGTIQVASGATFQQEAASTVGNMITAGTLALSNRNLTVFIDYNNANFGAGNSFNPRANVTGTGLILAAPNVAQVVTGAGVTNGGTTTPTLTIGNVHVGANTFNYQIANTGTTGPALRGALQTAVNSGNITDARLSGSGVTASNFGPVATGANTGNLGVTFTAASAGALAPLSGQVVHIINNFDNVADQNLSIVLGAGAAAYNLAAASATPNPVNFGNVRVGTATDQALSITNTAPNDGFSEKLNASISTNGAPVTASGSFNLLGPQATDNTSLHVGIDTSSAGAKSGSATIALVSDGTGTSGLGTTSLTSQTVNVSGNVYQVAQGQLNTAPLSFGTVQVGQTVQQTLSISNVATGPAGFVEDLNASFGNSTGTGAGAISGTGSISGLVAGGTNSNTMVVNVNTSGAGTINGAIAVNYFTAGAVSGVSNGLSVASVGSESFGVSGVIQAVGQIVDQAQPVINTAQPINLGNVRIGAASPTAFVSVTNQATGNQQAALNASISGNAPITASGSFNLLAPGATDSTSLQVGMNTGAAGAINGTATIAFVSDASNIGGCTPNCQLNLVSQNVQVTGNVYRLANPTLNTPSVTLAARVGDTAPSASVSVTNTSPDAFTEGLKASFGTTTAGFTPTGSIANLAAGGTDASNLNVALASTATSQNVSGTAQVNFESTGAGTTGATDISVGSTLVNLVGKVYQQAVALVNTAAVNFGIVHVGDVVTAQNVSVTNNAPSAVLNDVLTGSISATGPFTAGGNLGAGLGAGATDASSLMVGLDTSTAGSFNGQATISAQSHNADMADLALGNALVSLSATVNNYAVADLKKTGGAGNFTSSGNIFTLDLGNLVQGTGAVDALLEALNNVAGPSDLLNGSFDLSGSTHFQLTGFNNFADLGAGDAAALEIGFDPTLLGLVSDTITLSAFGHNASGFVGDTQVLTLILKANVVAESVPEPGSLALVGIALLALAIIRRNSARPQ